MTDGLCSCCQRPIGRYIWYVDGKPLCDRCFREELDANFDLLDLADLLGYEHEVNE